MATAEFSKFAGILSAALSQHQVTFIQASRGDSRPNNQTESERDQGGFILKGRFVEAIRETLVRRDVLGTL